MKFKKILQKTLNEMGMRQIQKSGIISDLFFGQETYEQMTKRRFDSYINQMKEDYPDDYYKRMMSDLTHLKNFLEQKDPYYKTLDKGLDTEESFKRRKVKVQNFYNLLTGFLEENKPVLPDKKGRETEGFKFEDWFSDTYEVEKAEKIYRKSNIEVKFKKPKSDKKEDIFPSMKMFQFMDVDEIKIEDRRGTAFLLFKADFKNSGNTIFNKIKQQHINIKGEPQNYFELKTSPSTSFFRKIMFSEFKKIATRDSFIKTFGSEETVTSWESLSKIEQKKQWNMFLDNIRQDAQEKINHYNEIISYIQDTLNEIKPNVEANIARRLKNVLHNRGWFLVKGSRVKQKVSFYRIDLDKFIQNIFFQTTEWAGIKRIKIDISPSMITDRIEDNHIKNNIINLAEEEEGDVVSLSFKISAELDGEINIDFAKEYASKMVAQDILKPIEPQQISLAASTNISKKNLLKD